MADNDTQGQEDTLWWALDDLPDPSLPGTGFDEPLVWPEALVWDDAEPTATGAGEPLVLPDAPPIDLDAGFMFPPVAQAPVAPPAEPEPAPAPEPTDDFGVNWTGDDQEVTAYYVEPLAALGGGAGVTAAAATAAPAPRPPATGDHLPDSIWSDAPGTASGDGHLVGTTPAATAFYAEAESGRRSARGRRFDIRHGNAGVIALISLASLVLLGMFLSVRARNDVPTDSSQTRLPAGDGIAVTSPLNTVPLTTPVTTAAPSINIAGLIPPPEDTVTTTGSGGGTSATTAAPRASTPATTTATTAPATQPTTATTAAPPTTQATTTTQAPVEDTTSTTSRRTTPSFTMPTFTIPGGQTFPMPSIPS
jgi:hypothetical protein